MKLILPWPPRELHPNARVHWSKRAKLTKAARASAGWEAKAIAKGEPIPDGTIRVHLVFCPPDRRHRDMDGCLSSMKGMLDGLADGLGVDDRRFTLSMEWGSVVKGGRVEVTISL